MFLDDSVALLIPIISVTLALLIPIFAIYFSFKKEQVRRQERIKAMEMGKEIPEEPTEEPLKPLDYLRRGLLSLAVGVALWVGGIFLVSNDFIVLAGVVVFFVGIALLVYYRIGKIREE